MTDLVRHQVVMYVVPEQVSSRDSRLLDQNLEGFECSASDRYKGAFCLEWNSKTGVKW